MAQSTEIIKGYRETTLDSWREFTGVIETKHHDCPALIYRGQADATWPVKSSMDRWEERFPTYLGGRFGCPPVTREVHLVAFQHAVKGRRGSNPPELSEDEWWVLGQHHGLKTPMLDWTMSPFVALFFAFEEKCIDGNEPESRAVFVLSSSCILQEHSKEAPAPLPYTPLKETSPRLVNQAGLLLRMPEECDLQEYVQTHFENENSAGTPIPMGSHARCILEKIVIPNTDRTDCLKLLNKMNINRSSLFPDLDGAAQYVNAMWELDWDTSLGHLPDSLQENL